MTLPAQGLGRPGVLRILLGAGTATDLPVYRDAAVNQATASRAVAGGSVCGPSNS